MMPSYFKPLRRKIGAVTLMMACALLAGWVRSHSFPDQVTFRIHSTSCFLTSMNGSVYGEQFTDSPNGSSLFDDLQLSWTLHYQWADYQKKLDAKSRREVDFCWCGFKYSAGTIHGQIRLVRWSIPYFGIATPFALLSAGLLLSKPRTRKANPVLSETQADS